MCELALRLMKAPMRYLVIKRSGSGTGDIRPLNLSLATDCVEMIEHFLSFGQRGRRFVAGS